MTMVGLGFDVVDGVRIAGTIVPFVRGNLSVALSSHAQAALSLPWPAVVKLLTSLEYIQFSAPSIVANTTASRRLLQTTDSNSTTVISTSSSYASSDLAIVFPNGFRFAYTLNSLVYYTKSSCTAIGEWQEDGSGGW